MLMSLFHINLNLSYSAFFSYLNGPYRPDRWPALHSRWLKRHGLPQGSGSGGGVFIKIRLGSQISQTKEQITKMA